jgi:hypothetical protein
MVLRKWRSEKLESLEHLALNSEDILRRVRSTKCGEDCVLLKLDLKDFYMDGDHERLVRAVVEEFARDPRVDWVRDTLEHVLFFQYVIWNEQVYQVTRGSGMGARHSSTVSDLAFYNIVEKHVLGSPGITLYVRYRDDLLVVAENDMCANQFMKSLCARAAVCWRVTEDSRSLYKSMMLDVLLYKGPGFWESGFLDYAPYVKPTARAVPLCWTSAHPRHCHLSWPLSEIRRMRRLSQHFASFRYHKTRLVGRFARFNLDHQVLSSCGRDGRIIQKKTTRTEGPGRVLRLVVRYHPFLRSLGSSLQKLWHAWQTHLVPCFKGRSRVEAVSFQVAFKAAAQPLHVVLRRV